MSNELIEVATSNFEGKEVLTVDARKIHSRLRVKTGFNIWITRRISEYKFTLDLDYQVLIKNDQNLQGGRPAKEYHVSVTMAKELAIVENNEEGRKYRRQLIELEEKITQGLKLQAKTSPAELYNSYRLMFLDLGVGRPLAYQLAFERVAKEAGVQYLQELKDLIPEAHIENISTNLWKETYNATYLGGLLGISANKFNKLLLERGYMYREGMLRHPTSKGLEFSWVPPYTDTNKPYTIYWKIEILELVK